MSVGNKKHVHHVGIRMPIEEVKELDKHIENKDGGRSLWVRNAIREQIRRETQPKSVQEQGS